MTSPADDRAKDLAKVIPLTRRELIGSRRQYLEAFDGLLATARRELRVFDPDCTQLELNAPVRHAALRQFLLASADNRLFVVVHDPEHLKRGCPRMLDLVRDFSFAVAIHQSERQVLDETMEIGGEQFGNEQFGTEQLTYCAVTLGNPHCVVLSEAPSEALARRLGPLIEVERRFPNRTNVQFLRLLDRSSIQIYIWERGAGYTLASGSSSCGAAAVAYRLGWVGARVAVHNRGGLIQVAITPNFYLTMTGPVERVYG